MYEIFHYSAAWYIVYIALYVICYGLLPELELVIALKNAISFHVCRVTQQVAMSEYFLFKDQNEDEWVKQCTGCIKKAQSLVRKEIQKSKNMANWQAIQKPSTIELFHNG